MTEQARKDQSSELKQTPESYQPDVVPPSLRVIQGSLRPIGGESGDIGEEMKSVVSPVPALAYDGGTIYVSMDTHDEAVEWFTTHTGWKLQHRFDNRRRESGLAIFQERKTLLSFGTSIQSIENQEGTDALTVALSPETRFRWCWRTRDLTAARLYLQQEGTRVGEIYRGPGGHDYFDFWATSENVLLTAQGDSTVSEDSPRFVPSWNRTGVADLGAAKLWYETHIGMRLLEDRTADGYLLMGLNLEHHPEENSQWILEQVSRDEPTGRLLDGAARPHCVLHDPEQFANYHAYLKNSGITVSEIVGYPPVKGFSWFHLYDPDGNRFDVIRY